MADDLLRNVMVAQSIFSRSPAFDGAYPMMTPFEIVGVNPRPRVWINVQYPTFFDQRKLSAALFLQESMKDLNPEFISSPEIGFLKALGGTIDITRTKVIFKFMTPDEVEPSTKQKYSSLLQDLPMIKTFASGIIVPIDYIGPVDNARVLQPATTVVSDAHKAEALNYFGAENSQTLWHNRSGFETEVIANQQKLQISLNNTINHAEMHQIASIPTNRNHVSTGLKLSYDDEERNSTVTSASGSMTMDSSIILSLSDNLRTELDRQKDEVDQFLKTQSFHEFQSFSIGKELEHELATPFDKSKSHPVALTTETYGVSKMELLKACVSREYLLMKRSSFVYAFGMVKIILTASITMTLYLRTKMHKDTTTDGSIFLGAIFFAIVSIMFSGFAELAMSILKLPVFYKQRDLLFFPAWAYALPTWILRIPISLCETTVWVGMIYYVSDFDPNAGSAYFSNIILCWRS